MIQRCDDVAKLRFCSLDELPRVRAIQADRPICWPTAVPNVRTSQAAHVSTGAFPLGDGLVLLQVRQEADELGLDEVRLVGTLNDESSFQGIASERKEKAKR